MNTNFFGKLYISLVFFVLLSNLTYATVYTTDQCMDGTATASSQFGPSYSASRAFNDLIDNLGW